MNVGEPLNTIPAGVVASCWGCEQEWRIDGPEAAERVVAAHTGPGHHLQASVRVQPKEEVK